MIYADQFLKDNNIAIGDIVIFTHYDPNPSYSDIFSSTFLCKVIGYGNSLYSSYLQLEEMNFNNKYTYFTQCRTVRYLLNAKSKIRHLTPEEKVELL